MATPLPLPQKARVYQVHNPHTHRSLRYRLELSGLSSASPYAKGRWQLVGRQEEGRVGRPGLWRLWLPVPGSLPGRECRYLPRCGGHGLTQSPPPRPKRRGPLAEKMICINNNFTPALPADGPDLEKACRQSLKSDFCFLGHLEFFFVSLTVPRTIY